MKSANFLIVGSGAREHAIARSLAKSKRSPGIYCFGSTINPGIKKLCKQYHVGEVTAVDDVVEKAKAWEIDIAIIGPEAPLEKGLADALWAAGIATVGPKQKLAQIETSKSFARNLLKKYYGKGSPEYRVFSDMFGVRDYLEKLGQGKYVVKANGLMGGKGVKVAGEHLHTLTEAFDFCQSIYEQGMTFVIEEKLIGQEFSYMCFCDGSRLVPMPLVQDHKRAYEKDEGPNTGGMGSYSNANHTLPFLSEKDVEAATHINQAIITALTAEYREPYIGILYGSYIATKKGVYLIEFNARFGDPESLNVLPILESDFVDICVAMVQGNLNPEEIHFANLATVCKYAVPEGYPDSPVKNSVIDISAVKEEEQLFLASVNEIDGKLYATGSRAVAVVGIAETILNAERIAEEEINRIEGKLFHRTDIGTRELINHKIFQMQELRQRDYRML